jgi:beta-phosphoglucomutase
MHVKGILFDFDGVILDSMKYHFQAWRKALAQYAVEIDRQFFNLLEGQGINGVGASLLRETGLKSALLPQITANKIHHFNRIFQVEFYDGFVPFLEYLAKHALKLGIVTGGMRTRIEQVVNAYLPGYFHAVVTAEDVSYTKPHPEPYLKGAEKLTLKPEQCLVIENAPLGITAAKKAGMTVLAIQTTLDKKFLKEADFCLPSFAELHHLVATFL